MCYLFSVNSNGQMAWNDLKLQLYTNQLVQNWVLDNFGRPKWPKFAFLATFRSKIGQIFVNLALFWPELWSKLIKFRLLAEKKWPAYTYGPLLRGFWASINFPFWKLLTKHPTSNLSPRKDYRSLWMSQYRHASLIPSRLHNTQRMPQWRR